MTRLRRVVLRRSKSSLLPELSHRGSMILRIVAVGVTGRDELFHKEIRSLSIPTGIGDAGVFNY